MLTVKSVFNFIIIATTKCFLLASRDNIDNFNGNCLRRNWSTMIQHDQSYQWFNNNRYQYDNPISAIGADF